VLNFVKLARSKEATMRDVSDGAIVAFECLGDVHVPDHRFLDDVTNEGRIKLSPSFDPPFTGARWQCLSLGNGAFALVSAGAVHGLRYLDGRTQDGVVQGVGDTLPPFSGTRWQIQELSPGVVTITFTIQITSSWMVERKLGMALLGSRPQLISRSAAQNGPLMQCRLRRWKFILNGNKPDPT
jgi:hypothetical protein